MNKVKSTPFSDFIRNATPEEKERVYMSVMERAEAEQQFIMLIAALNELRILWEKAISEVAESFPSEQDIHPHVCETKF